MPLTINVGDNTPSVQNIVTVAVTPGTTVNLANVAGSTLNYFTAGIDGPAQTLTSGNNVNLTEPAYIQSQGTTTVTLSGGQYG